MRIKGIITNIIFKNENNGYAIISVRYKKTTLTLVGEMWTIDEGYYISAEVKEIYNKVYGQQYEVLDYEIDLPDEREAIIKVLSSVDFKGIGEALATRLVETFGCNIFEVIKHEPESILSVKGMTEKRLKTLQRVTKEKELELKNMAYLKKYSLNIRQIKSIIKKYRTNCVEIIEKNPYELALNVNGISFPTCEKIAILNRLDLNTNDRDFALVTYLLKEAYRSGNVFLYYNDLICILAEYKLSEDINDILYKMQQKNIIKVILNKEVTTRNSKIYLMENYNIEYSLTQILYSFRDNIKIITGGPGTGKTYNINKIIEENNDKGLNIILCAPTGRAAKRITEITKCEAKTIHRTLEFTKTTYSDGEVSYSFVKNENNKLDCDILIVDEMSMVDEYLMYNLMKATRDTTKIYLVGDKDQLPSVGAGNVLNDMINSSIFDVVKLNKIYRQVENSNIIKNAHKVNNGELIDLSVKTDDFIFVHRNDDEKILNDISVLVSKNIPRHFDITIDKIQVLTTTRKGMCSVSTLNKFIQDAVNPANKNTKQIKYMDTFFRVNDKVMQIVNNYDLIYECFDKDGIKYDEGFGVFNGDIGIITDIDENNSIITVLYDDKYVEYGRDDFSNLDLAYAITVHKSQGSEYDVVVMSMSNTSKFLMNRKILYTAITRAKKAICFIGMEDIFNKMVENKFEEKRNSALCDSFYIS